MATKYVLIYLDILIIMKNFFGFLHAVGHVRYRNHGHGRTGGGGIKNNIINLTLDLNTNNFREDRNEFFNKSNFYCIDLHHAQFQLNPFCS